MKFGVMVNLCQEGISVPPGYASIEQLLELLVDAERLGYDTVWCNDHLIVPNALGSKYKTRGNLYEVIVTLAYAAALTRRVRLGTRTAILPLRDTILLAKQATTLDVVSGGRFALGVGLGAYREEFEAIRPKYSKYKRGEIFDEQCEALHLLLNQENVSYKGRNVEFHDISINPKPVQKPFPLIVTGEHYRNAERVSKWGTGWAMSNVDTAFIRRCWSLLMPLLESRSRDPQQVEFIVGTTTALAATRERAISELRRALGDVGDFDAAIEKSLVGTPSEVAETVHRLEEERVTHLVIYGRGRSFPELRELFFAFAEEVMAKLGNSGGVRTLDKVKE